MDLPSPTPAFQTFLYLNMPLPCLDAPYELEISQSPATALSGQVLTERSSRGSTLFHQKTNVPCSSRLSGTYYWQAGGMLETPGRARWFAGLRDNQTTTTFSSCREVQKRCPVCMGCLENAGEITLSTTARFLTTLNPALSLCPPSAPCVPLWLNSALSFFVPVLLCICSLHKLYKIF